MSLLLSSLNCDALDLEKLPCQLSLRLAPDIIRQISFQHLLHIYDVIQLPK